MNKYIITSHDITYGKPLSAATGLYGPYIASSPLNALDLCRMEYDFSSLTGEEVLVIRQADERGERGRG